VIVTTTNPPTTTTEKPVATSTSTIPVQTTVLQQTEQPQATTTTLPPQVTTTLSPVNEEQKLAEVLLSPAATKEEIVSAVDSLLKNDVSSEKATELATNEKVLQNITAEQASEIFSAIDVSTVTAEQAEQIVNAVQGAPEEVRESFEKEINVFDGVIDTYVPLGSSIPVGQRRVLIAVVATTMALPAAPTSRR
jgi:hypothetical protein